MNNLKRLCTPDIPYFDEVKNKFGSSKRVYDSRGKRWFKCKICGSILPIGASIGVVDIDSGFCVICYHADKGRNKK